MGEVLTTSPPLVSRRKQWSLAEFERMADLGLFGNEKFELIEGEVVPKMSQNPLHSNAILAVLEVLLRVFAGEFVVRPQLPLVLGESKPEPDFSVVAGKRQDYAGRIPTTALLVVEVSDSTLRDDQTVKAALYARAEIPEYWIVNLQDRVLEVHRQPIAAPGQPLGFGYRSLTRFYPGDAVAPLAALQDSISVAELLL